MKKFILAIAAATVVMTPVASASAAPRNDRIVVKQAKANKQINRYNRQVVKQNRQIARQHQRIQARQWNKGQRFDRRYVTNYRVVDYRQYRNQRLYAPPRGYQWHQSGNDAVLVSIASGLIGAVIGGALFN